MPTGIRLRPGDPQLPGADRSRAPRATGLLLGLLPGLLLGLVLLIAGALGVPPERSRLVLLGAGTCLTAMAVAAAGPIPFVTMAAPQLARRVTRAAGPGVLPAAWTGAVLVTAADLVTSA